MILIYNVLHRFKNELKCFLYTKPNLTIFPGTIPGTFPELLTILQQQSD